jgi:hypothetical protein
VGLTESSVEWFSRPWDAIPSISGIEVFPFLGVLKEQSASDILLTLASSEVAEASWIAWEKLFDTTQWAIEEHTSQSGAVLSLPVFYGWHHRTWGLTAIFLALLVCRISGRLPYSSLGNDYIQ